MLELMQLGAARRAATSAPARASSRAGSSNASLSRGRSPAIPQLVVCDEPTSALDVSVQAAILNLLVELQAKERVSYLFISHDLGVVRYVSDRIAVLYLGRLMELGASEVVFYGPHHPYTEALLSAVPTIDGGERDADQARGRHPERSRSAVRLRLPHALPAADRRRLRRGRAASRRGRAGPPDALPHPDRGAARSCRRRPDEPRRQTARAAA